jgi:hypothetical protein
MQFESEEKREGALAEVVIVVASTEKTLAHENGYCFLEENPGWEEEQQSAEKYFKGYKYVLFNIMNSFRVRNRSVHRGRHVVELEYGYVARQHFLREEENYIPQE